LASAGDVASMHARSDRTDFKILVIVKLSVCAKRRDYAVSVEILRSSG
jgi:hypothetical protein